MKKIVLLFLMAINLSANAQVAINTDGSLPDNSAMLDVKSTTRGILIPSMTTTQRNAIVAPAEGLLIYNLTSKELNQRQNGAWKILLNNESWTGGGSGQIFNIGDNVGINTAGPSERLDVSGNIRSNSSVIIDNSSAILQLKSAAENKGFVQLSGDNLRLGTNSGNTAGNVVVRMDGNDLITINPQGDMNTEGKITKPATGLKSLLPLCYGKVEFSAASSSTTSNVTVTRTSTGVYEIYCNGLISTSTMILTMNEYAGGEYVIPRATFTSNGHFTVYFYNKTYPPNSDAGFSFIAYQ